MIGDFSKGNDKALEKYLKKPEEKVEFKRVTSTGIYIKGM